MAADEVDSGTGKPVPVYVVSGGAGASGDQLVRTVLAQFRGAEVPVVTVPHVRRENQLEEVVASAGANRGIIVHTLVDAGLRRTLARAARENDVVAIDLMGPLLSRMTRVLKRRPLGQPGLYRQLREDYFERIEAIEYTVAHDDGRSPQELDRAEIVLVGVSRVGKTPLSMYLSVLGWKVANVPLVRDVPPPEPLFRVDRRRVVGLAVDPDQLVIHRRVRGRRMGIGAKTPYSDVAELREELEAAFRICRKHGFVVVDVTDKPIEESATEVVALVTRQLGERGDGPG
jgi:regulator of PEP synthase PpsR (kinase-PPPase family)